MARFRMYPLRANNVIQLYQWQDRIDLDPPYQRLSVWDDEKQRCFIDSVINGFDIPKLYFHEVPAASDRASQYKYAVVDGKQRLLALWKFMSNNLPLSHEFKFFDDEAVHAAGCTYEDLLRSFPRLRARFDSFDVPVTIVQTDDDNFVEELFARLNIQVPLSAPERRNALGGPLPYVIRKIGIAPFFGRSARIGNKRLQHFDLATKFLYLVRANGIESTKRTALNDFVTKFRKLREQGAPEASEDVLQALEGRTLAILDAMQGFFDDDDWLLASHGRIILYFHIFRICQRLGQQVPFNRQMLAQFNDEVAAARKKSQRRAVGSDEKMTDIEHVLVDFDREKQSPNDAGAIRRQYGYLKQYFQQVFDVELPDSD